MPIITNEYNARSTGGTELSIAEFNDHVDAGLLAKVEIIPSRFRGFATELPKIYWVHDTCDDPEMKHLADGGWKKFDKIVFVSNWQMQSFVNYFQIPWSHCEVAYNAIRRFPPSELDFSGPLRFIYHTTPHRGLHILAAAFSELAKRHTDLHLDVYSSFNIYGWPEHDKPYEKLFEMIKEHPSMTYHGSQPNDVIRKALLKTHVFAFPSIWPETGCRALIEAMAAGVFCVHSNFGCLYETARGFTLNYQHREDQNEHATRLFNILNDLVPKLRATTDMREYRASRAAHANGFYAWDYRKETWNDIIRSVIKEPK